jgi:hypothetical protein
MYSKETAFTRISTRGPRWVVAGTLRPNEIVAEYAETAQAAEKLREQFEAQNYRQVRVYPPQGGVDLAKLGRERAEAWRRYTEATDILRAGVLRALEEERSENEISRTAGIDRQTVRAWAGKQPMNRG